MVTALADEAIGKSTRSQSHSESRKITKAIRFIRCIIVFYGRFIVFFCLQKMEQKSNVDLIAKTT